MGHDLLRYLVKNMLFPSVATLPLLQAYRNHVKGYELLHGFKVRFETSWIQKPQPLWNMRQAGPTPAPSPASRRSLLGGGVAPH